MDLFAWELGEGLTQRPQCTCVCVWALGGASFYLVSMGGEVNFVTILGVYWERECLFFSGVTFYEGFPPSVL